MSFIPQNTAGINVITPKPGSGLTVQTSGNVDTITTDGFLPGTGITLTRNTVNNTITIGSSALGSGVTAVVPAVPAGCGIAINSTPGPAVTVDLQGAYVAGTGITLTPSTTPGNPTITVANAMDITSAPASGITITQAGTGQDAQVALNLTAGSGIALAPGVGTAQAISNAMTVSGSGAGVSVVQTGGAGGNVVIQNTGVASVAVSGAGLSTSGATGAITLQNTGVTSLAAGNGVSVSGSTGAITVANTMALTAGNGIIVTQAGPGQNATIATNITAGQGIQVSGTSNRVVQNTMTLTAGSGIAITQASPGANAVISATGAASGTFAKYSMNTNLSGLVGSNAVFNLASIDVSAMTGANSFTFYLSRLIGQANLGGTSACSVQFYLSDSPTNPYNVPPSFLPVKSAGCATQFIAPGPATILPVAADEAQYFVPLSLFNTGPITTLYLNMQCSANNGNLVFTTLDIGGWLEGRTMTIV